MTVPGGLLAYIPSPSSNGIQIGPVNLRAYGLFIALGVLAAIWLTDRRWRARGGQPGVISSIAFWAVPGGLIGARLYHIVTDYELYTHHPLNAFKIWAGGLGIWGAVAGGVAGGAIYVRRHHLDLPALLDCVAPALPLAQAIGRWGNYFNQELFGRPSGLPWALRIDPSHRPAAYANVATFHPTFLYESLWDLAVVLFVLWADKHIRLRKGYLFAVYVAAYTFGRFWTEYLRIDFAHKFLGLRLNDWVSIAIFTAAVVLLVTRGRPDRGGETDEAELAASGDSASSVTASSVTASSVTASGVTASGDELASGRGSDKDGQTDGPELAARGAAEGGDDVVPGPGDP